MRKIILISVFFISATWLSGQNGTKWQSDFLEPHIGFESQYFSGAPHISNSFLDAYFNGDFIDAAMKNAALAELESQNIFGAFNNFKLSLTRPLNSFYFDYLHLAAENQNFLDLAFDEKLFSLYFKGNSQYAGQTIEIDESLFNFSSFTRLKAGLIKSFYTPRFIHTFAINGSVNVGTTHNSLVLKNATLFTEADGTHIDMSVNADMLWAKNNTDDAVRIFNGLGGGLDLFYRFECDKGNNFSIALNNIGFIRWFEQHSKVLHKDTSLVFEGILIEDILNINTTTDKLSADSLKETFDAYTLQKAFNTYTPASLQAFLSHDFNDKLSAGLGMVYYFHLSARPYYFVDVKYQIFDRLQLVPNISMGGYAGFNAGMDVVLNHSDYYCYFGTDYLTSLIAKDPFKGKGFYFKIVKKLYAYETSSFKPRTIDMH